MSNLGLYQKMTEIAKKVGGPKKLFQLVFGSGIIVGASGTTLCVLSVKKAMRNNMKSQDKTIYCVKKYGVSNEGLQFKIGDKFRVLEIDKDAVLIEKIGDANNPYFVSYDLLNDISDYGKGKHYSKRFER